MDCVAAVKEKLTHGADQNDALQLNSLVLK